jgi:hypothetical protein
MTKNSRQSTHKYAYKVHPMHFHESEKCQGSNCMALYIFYLDLTLWTCLHYAVAFRIVTHLIIMCDFVFNCSFSRYEDV